MDKFAQQRSLRSKIYETVNLTGATSEALHSELQEAMDEIRGADQKIREYAQDTRFFIRTAKSYLRRREYLNAATAVAAFHERCRHIEFTLKKLINSREIKHFDYFLDNLDPSNKEMLFSYNPNEEIKEACEEFNEIVKEAGIYDAVKHNIQNISDITQDTGSNIITNKGRSRRLLEKRFDFGFMQEIKTKTAKLVQEAEKMFRHLIKLFDEMESGVSRRNPKLYQTKAKEFIKYFTIFHKVFDDYDKTILKQLREHEASRKAEEQKKADEIAKEKIEKEQQAVEEAKKSPLVTPFKSSYDEPSFEEWEKENIPSGEENIKVLDKLEKERQKAAHSSFINELEIHASKEDTHSFIQKLLDYSEQLEDKDPESSSHLLMIAKNVINDYKTAGIFDKIFKSKSTDTQNPSQQELQKEYQPARKKPFELIEEDKNKYKKKKINLPDGTIDQAYTDIQILSTITPDKIRITHEAGNHIKNLFIRRLINAKDIDDFEPYIEYFNRNLFPALKHAIYNGWVLSSSDVQDDFNPQDRYIEIYTRLNLADIHPNLSGIAKLYINTRISANTGKLTVRSIKKHFSIDNPKEKKVITPPLEQFGPQTPRSPEMSPPKSLPISTEQEPPATKRIIESKPVSKLENDEDEDMDFDDQYDYYPDEP